MAEREITREGVLKAIEEFERLGRDTFLSRYGYGSSKGYDLIHEGQRYDSKAIAGVAYKWTPGSGGRALAHGELSGGRTDAVKRLEALGFVVEYPNQKELWTRDEHVLALDLYMTNPASPPGKASKQVRELSELLNRLGERRGAVRGETYRNAAGVYMKMMNFRRLDPRFQAEGKVGLSQGSKGEEVVWREFDGRPDALRAEAARIRAAILKGAALTSNALNTPVVDALDIRPEDAAFTPSLGLTPTFGQRTAEYADGLNYLYVLRLDGELLPALMNRPLHELRGKAVVKAGYSKDPRQRLKAHNGTLPPAARVAWKLELKSDAFPSAEAAKSAEDRLKAHFNTRFQSLGNEFFLCDERSLASEFFAIARQVSRDTV